jgi:hypothetical protein
MAYEMKNPVLSAREWLDGGGLPTAQTVIGITGLDLAEMDTEPTDGEVSFRASYTLWLPGSFTDPEPAEAAEPAEPAPEEYTALPRKIFYRDEVRLFFRKGLWRIGDIRRESPAR